MDGEVQKMTRSGPLCQHPLPPSRHQPHPFILSAQKTNQKETKNPEKGSNPQQIVLFCLCLRMQNPGLREVVDLEHSPKKVSTKIIMLRQRRKNATENKLHHRVWTHKQELRT